jgi:L-fuculose-phosphate aldolase
MIMKRIDMDMDMAAETLCEAGLRLLSQGLVSRTWGNISLRLDEERFMVTPSGRDYESLAPADMVVVRMSDLRHEGRIRPSSEKELHREIYLLRPDMGAVIHTHQTSASIVSASGREIPCSRRDAALLGPSVMTAPYALPGTHKLAAGTARCLKDRKAALMANHGAVCAGADMEEAFAVSERLESLCRDYIRREFMKFSGKRGRFSEDALHACYLEALAGRRRS